MLYLAQHAQSSCPNVLHKGFYKNSNDGHYDDMAPASPSRSHQMWLVDPWRVHPNSGCPRISSRPNCPVRNQLEITMWARRRGGQSCACRVNISFRTHVKGLLKMCAGPCSPRAAPWKWQALRFSPLQDQVKSIKIYYSYGSAVTSLKAACNFRRERRWGEVEGKWLWTLASQVFKRIRWPCLGMKKEEKNKILDCKLSLERACTDVWVYECLDNSC